MAGRGVIAQVMLLYRRPDLTPEQFSQYWRNVHAPIITKWAMKHGALSYCQVHNTQSYADTLRASGFDFETFDCDGIALVEYKSLQHLQEGFKDPYFVDVIQKDEEQFLDKKTSRITGALGDTVNIIRDSKVVLEFTGN